PIYAAGDGVIESIVTNCGYGKYIRIRHNSTYKTAYAHMRRYANGLRRGSRVSQGQIIGFVGSTGRSTGPHLHYEVMSNGDRINPQSLDLPRGEALEGGDRTAFVEYRDDLDRRYGLMAASTQIAQAPDIDPQLEETAEAAPEVPQVPETTPKVQVITGANKTSSLSRQ
ncbi:MAG: M23 family metallopeptidase, partial [Alphaproteobacteria bacterium]|nr:M23 family metallopeptidase [Alphaproteobacteria bacterium]